MIKSVRLYNFKAFRDTGDIEIKPLTVLAGPNSGGKSSFLQSLLLLKQSAELEVPDVNAPFLNLDGRFVQVTGLRELIFGKPPLRNCQLKYEILIETQMPADRVPTYFPDQEISGDSKHVPLQSLIEFSFRYGKYKDIGAGVILGYFKIQSWVESSPRAALVANIGADRDRVTLSNVQLPKRFQKRRIHSLLGSRFIPVMMRYKTRTRADEAQTFEVLPLHPLFSNPIHAFERELRKLIRYLGPLREMPKRAYLHAGTLLPEIGQRGEYAAQILWVHKDKKIKYCPYHGQEPTESTLINAVNETFQQLGISESMHVTSQKSIIYQLLFGLTSTKRKRMITIADVGFGVSQLLPIIVLGLLSEQGSLLLYEQPEIHLHPRLQANLADFFLSLTSTKKRIIVETHSDHFINRLRRRIAEDKSGEIKNKVSILFVRPPQDVEGATIDPLRINEFGVVENWPPDFLPESSDEAEAIFRAGLKKRLGK